MLENAVKLKIDVTGTTVYGNVNDILPKIKPNRLEILRLSGFNNKIQFKNLPIYLTLKHLEAPRNGFNPDLLVKHFPNLEYLEIGDAGLTGSCEPLVNLSKLKHLSLIYGKRDYDHVFPLINEIANRNQLEVFKMYDDFRNNNNGKPGRSFNLIKNHGKMETNFANNLQQMTNLKTLGLATIFSFNDHLEEIAGSLKELRHFEFGCTFGRCGIAKEKELVPEILKFVAKSEKLVKLSLKFHAENITQNFYDDLVNIRRSNKSKEILVVVIQQHECKQSESRYASTLAIKGDHVQMSFEVQEPERCDVLVAIILMKH